MVLAIAKLSSLPLLYSVFLSSLNNSFTVFLAIAFYSCQDTKHLLILQCFHDLLTFTLCFTVQRLSSQSLSFLLSKNYDFKFHIFSALLQFADSHYYTIFQVTQAFSCCWVNYRSAFQLTILSGATVTWNLGSAKSNNWVVLLRACYCYPFFKTFRLNGGLLQYCITSVLPQSCGNPGYKYRC